MCGARAQGRAHRTERAAAALGALLWHIAGLASMGDSKALAELLTRVMITCLRSGPKGEHRKDASMAVALIGHSKLRPCASTLLCPTAVWLGAPNASPPRASALPARPPVSPVRISALCHPPPPCPGACTAARHVPHRRRNNVGHEQGHDEVCLQLTCKESYQAYVRMAH